MEKFKFLLLPIICALLPACVQPQLNSPFPVVYPVDVGHPDHVQEFFQYSQAEMGFTRIFYANSDKGSKLPAHNISSPIDMGSLLYRTHKEKGILFLFDGIKEAGIMQIRNLINFTDRASNVYHVPVVVGTGGNKESLIDHERLLDNITLYAKVAFGFSENVLSSRRGRQQPPGGDGDKEGGNGYTQDMIKDLANITDPYCSDMNSNFYVAFNAYYVGAAASDVKFEYYKNFKRCRLLLYSLPRQPVVNVARVKKLLLDQVNMNRMQVLCAGRHIAHRLFSLESVAWGYVKGHHHPKVQELGESGLLSVLNSGATMIRLKTFMLRNTKYLKPMPLFRNMTEWDMYRTNFDADNVYYLAQVTDYSRIVYLSAHHWTRQLMDYVTMAFAPKFLPFFEAPVVPGPNAENFDPKQAQAFWSTVKEMNKNVIRKIKPVFAFVEGHGRYSQKMINEMAQTIELHSGDLHEARFGIALDIQMMNNELVFDNFLRLEKFQFVFLKSDSSSSLTLENMHEMKKWVPKFKDKMVFLMMNDNTQNANLIYRYFSRVEPNDTSTEYLTTPAPEVSTTVTKLTTEEETSPTPPNIILTPKEPTEPPLIEDTTDKTKSRAAKVSQWNTSWAASLLGMVLCTAVVG